MDIKEIIADLNVSICDIETLKNENPDSTDLARSVGQIKAARASLCAFRGKFDRPAKLVSRAIPANSTHQDIENWGKK